MGMVSMCFEVSPKQLEAAIANPGGALEYLDTAAGDSAICTLDLDKSWHGIHYLITGEAWSGEGPASKAILGGSEIGDDLGYGPIRYLTPEEVRVTAGELKAITNQMLEERYRPASLEQAEVYPSGIWESEGKEALNYVMTYFKRLVSFYGAAAANGNAVLLMIV